MKSRSWPFAQPQHSPGGHSGAMDTASQPHAEPAWGTPDPEPAHWSRNKTLAAAGIALVLAVGGAAVIHAAGGTSSGGPGGGPGWGPPPGGTGGFGGPPAAAGGPAGTADALHGVFVVPDDHGGFQTEVTQTGTVTEVSDTSITARSDDGFTQSYILTTDTRTGHAAMHAGDRATIRAVQRGGTNTATVISPIG